MFLDVLWIQSWHCYLPNPLGTFTKWVYLIQGCVIPSTLALIVMAARACTPALPSPWFGASSEIDEVGGDMHGSKGTSPVGTTRVLVDTSISVKGWKSVCDLWAV